jgi:hypothetical protein
MQLRSELRERRYTSHVMGRLDVLKNVLIPLLTTYRDNTEAVRLVGGCPPPAAALPADPRPALTVKLMTRLTYPVAPGAESYRDFLGFLRSYKHSLCNPAVWAILTGWLADAIATAPRCSGR